LVAFYKTVATAQGANIIRREHGLPETYVPPNRGTPLVFGAGHLFRGAHQSQNFTPP
jgi:hypothetical protein